MRTKLRVMLLALPLVAACGGCCAPKELFSWIDRHCFVADWTNHHSCVSCCNCKNHSCQHPGHPPMPMLVLGDPPAEENVE